MDCPVVRRTADVILPRGVGTKSPGSIVKRRPGVNCEFCSGWCIRRGPPPSAAYTTSAAFAPKPIFAGLFRSVCRPNSNVSTRPQAPARRRHRESFHAAWRTALAFVGGARPHCRLLSGQLIFLGDGGLFDRAALPHAVRHYALMGCGAATPELLARTPVTCLAGSAEGIDALLTQVKTLTGRDRLSELWPGLTAVLHTRRLASDESARHLRETLGDRVLLLETRFLPGGPVALEDPRRGCPLLLFDHGVYFEFTPAEEAGGAGRRRGTDSPRWNRASSTRWR